MKLSQTSRKRFGQSLVRSMKLTLLVAVAVLSLLSGTAKSVSAGTPTWFGINMAWNSYGSDFGKDFYYGSGPTYNGGTMENYLADIQSKHMNVVRIWTMEDFSGLSFQNNNPDNPCTGVSSAFVNNLTDFCRRANNHGILVYVTFLTFSDVQKHPRVVTTNRWAFVQNALVPVARALAPYNVCYDLMNECNYSGLSWNDLRNYGNDARTALHGISSHWVTMSTDDASAFGGNFWNTVGGLGFDFYDCHRYSNSGAPLLVTPSQVLDGKPLFVGEYGPSQPSSSNAPYRWSGNSYVVDNFCQDAASKNYSGMLAWSYLPDNATARDNFVLQNTSELWTLNYYGSQWGR